MILRPLEFAQHDRPRLQCRAKTGEAHAAAVQETLATLLSVWRRQMLRRRLQHRRDPC
jgi:hypothetical protein